MGINPKRRHNLGARQSGRVALLALCLLLHLHLTQSVTINNRCLRSSWRLAGRYKACKDQWLWLVEHPTGEPGTSQWKRAILVPIAQVNGSDESALTGQKYGWDQAWQTTNIVLRWPVTHPPKRCLTILETNALAPADCPGSASCGNMAWYNIDKHWWGAESGLCVGSGATHVHLIGSQAYDGIGNPDHSWGRVYTLKPADEYTDVCDVAKDLALLRLKNKDVVFSMRSFHNYVSIVDNITTVSNPTLIKTHDGKACPAVRTAAERQLAIYYEGPTLHDWPQSVPILSMRDYTQHRLRFCGLNTTGYRVLGTSHIVSLSPTNYGFVEPWVESLVCAAHGHVTAYAFPGHKVLHDALTGAAELILDVLLSLFETIWSALVDSLSYVNKQYRVVELLVWGSFLLYYYDSPWRAGVGTLLFAGLFGIERE